MELSYLLEHTFQLVFSFLESYLNLEKITFACSKYLLALNQWLCRQRIHFCCNMLCNHNYKDLQLAKQRKKELSTKSLCNKWKARIGLHIVVLWFVWTHKSTKCRLQSFIFQSGTFGVGSIEIDQYQTWNLLKILLNP